MSVDWVEKGLNPYKKDTYMIKNKKKNYFVVFIMLA